MDKIRIFLAEDEVVMREGIKNNIDWESEGLEFVGDAGDGELALPLIRESRPDILVTDIRMPFMDGLELSRIVKQEQPNIRIMVLSGYDEFEYAKQAIDIGITEYLLKPITRAALLEAIKGVAEKIIAERESDRQQEADRFDISEVNPGQIDRRKVENFLRTGSVGEIEDFMDSFWESIGAENMESLMFRQYILMDVYFAASSFLEALGLGREDITRICGDFQSDTIGISNSAGAERYITKLLSAAIEYRNSASEIRGNRTVVDAKRYIDEHFADEDITLNTVAASVNVSPNHFSAVFKQEAGETFIEYLTGVRMEKAKELLRTTSMKSSEIGFAVGYKDPHYFSYSFKKAVGVTPREFRQEQ